MKNPAASINRNFRFAPTACEEGAGPRGSMPMQYNGKLLKRQYPENALFFLNYFDRFDILTPFGPDKYVLQIPVCEVAV
ncbi:MAG: hypothetical protein JRE21_03605 [Deltaproteobacteria bacterium]|jgi:hypothetical protein|nr:hypothetical protein [Deltaproteobacteria bacterium]